MTAGCAVAEEMWGTEVQGGNPTSVRSGYAMGKVFPEDGTLLATTSLWARRRSGLRHVTFRVLVNMDSMFPGRKISKIQPDLHALFCRYQLCCSDALAIRILQMDNFFVYPGRAE